MEPIELAMKALARVADEEPYMADASVEAYEEGKIAWCFHCGQEFPGGCSDYNNPANHELNCAWRIGREVLAEFPLRSEIEETKDEVVRLCLEEREAMLAKDLAQSPEEHAQLDCARMGATLRLEKMIDQLKDLRKRA